MTAHYAAFIGRFDPFNIYLGAKVGNDSAGDLWPQLRHILQIFLADRFFRGSAITPSLLNRLDTIYLTVIQSTLAHLLGGAQSKERPSLVLLAARI